MDVLIGAAVVSDGIDEFVFGSSGAPPATAPSTTTPIIIHIHTFLYHGFFADFNIYISPYLFYLYYHDNAYG
jgi:hypothetical protein